MAISSIDTFIPSIIGTYEPQTAKTEEKQSSFANLFQDVLQNAIDTDITDQDTALAVLANDDIALHDATIASTEAELSLRLTLEIRNKIVEAYTEVMRMQV